MLIYLVARLLLGCFHCILLFVIKMYLTLTNNLFINRGRHFVESNHRTTIMPPTCCKQTLGIWNSRSFPREDFSRGCAARAWALGGVRQSPRSPPHDPTPHIYTPGSISKTPTPESRPNHVYFMTAVLQLYFFSIISQVPENFCLTYDCAAKFLSSESFLSNPTLICRQTVRLFATEL